MDIADELLRLEQLRQSGALSEEEYLRAKIALEQKHAEALRPIYSQAAASAFPPPAAPPRLPPQPGVYPGTAEAALEREARQWAMMMHLSLFAGKVVPLAGFIVPIVMWQMKKDTLPGVDAHGRNIANWIISLCLYVAVCIPLVFFCVGVVFLQVLAVVAIILPIVGAIQANEGKVWVYPLAIPFF